MKGLPKNAVECNDCHEMKAGPKDHLCAGCRARQLAVSSRKYTFTGEVDERLQVIYGSHGNDRARLSRELKALSVRCGIPVSNLRTHASHKRWTCLHPRPWTPKEIAFLRTHNGEKSADWIARELKRSSQSVRTFACEMLQLSTRVTDGYAATELAQLFHVRTLTVQRWIEQGWLKRSAETGRVSEEQVRRFIFRHPEEYSLRMVEEFWFKGMIFPCFGQHAHELGKKAPSRNPYSLEERTA